jgi:hypothetical protein
MALVRAEVRAWLPLAACQAVQMARLGKPTMVSKRPERKSVPFLSICRANTGWFPQNHLLSFFSMASTLRFFETGKLPIYPGSCILNIAGRAMADFV